MFNSFGKYVDVFVKQVIKTLYKAAQWHIGIDMPVFSQKMVVKDIDDHTAVVAVCFVEACRTFVYRGMRIGKSVDVSVQQNSFCNGGRIFLILFSLNAIGYKVADNDTFIVSGEID